MATQMSHHDGFARSRELRIQNDLPIDRHRCTTGVHSPDSKLTSELWPRPGSTSALPTRIPSSSAHFGCLREIQEMYRQAADQLLGEIAEIEEFFRAGLNYPKSTTVGCPQTSIPSSNRGWSKRQTRRPNELLYV